MANMNYCRFQNTLKDLKECATAVFEDEELSIAEQEAKQKLITVCWEIISNQSDEVAEAEFNPLNYQ
jgi:hypothetical protein